ncbi:hypothetical protein [Actinomadura harenae]|uniref:DUF4307 domain-containing protein n=1 Tax=Actinomadura harenae TaxID=2483351 RepID=A0A3M2LLW3_9ACTN|nr:hypothetical protein [Actinomadura harenae]RMI37513.1 hypothetical protein EBO15_35725 [Actinomadura harenae]
MTGEDLEDWSDGEVVRIRRAMVWALRLTLLAVSMIVVAVVLTWTGPTDKLDSSLLIVYTDNSRYCGTITGAVDGRILLRVGKSTRIVPLASIKTMQTTLKCPA